MPSIRSGGTQPTSYFRTKYFTTYFCSLQLQNPILMFSLKRLSSHHLGRPSHLLRPELVFSRFGDEFGASEADPSAAPLQLGSDYATPRLPAFRYSRYISSNRFGSAPNLLAASETTIRTIGQNL